MTYSFNFISKELKAVIEPATLQSHKFDCPLGYRMFDNSYVAPYFDWDKSIGCILDENGAAVKDSECLEWKECEQYYDLSTALEEQKRVIFLGFFLTVFGHSFTDDLRKLWFLDTEECKALIADGWELVYTTSWNRVLPDYMIALFQLAGYDLSDARQITDITRFERVCIPDNSVIACEYGRKYCSEYKRAIDRIMECVPVGGKKLGRVYFSRTRYSHGSKREYGERDIERAFKKEGYSIIYPEEYSFLEQIQMVRNCDIFAATEGSVSHLCMFCRPGTNVVLVNKANYLNFHQVMINEFADLNVTYIEAHHSSKANLQHPWWGPFYLCVNRYLERYFNHRIAHFPYWMRFSYWRYTRNILYKCYNRTRKIVTRVFSGV